MDAFFAAVEQYDRPELRGKPVIVGGEPGGRGVVSTASYEARAFGVRSAMPAFQAKQLCPQGIFVRPRFERYSEVSARVMAVLHQHTDLVEPVSLDEAYLDVTRHKLKCADPVRAAVMIRQSIHAMTGLTASAGVSINCFLAKIASDQIKPDGLTVVGPGQVQDFLKDLPVRKLPGIGPVTEKRLTALGIGTCGDLAAFGRQRLFDAFGKSGVEMWERANGRDDRAVQPGGMPKQHSSEETFGADVIDVERLKRKLRDFSDELVEGLQGEGLTGRTVVLKLKYHDFQQITRSQTLGSPVKSPEDLYRVACRLLSEKTEAGRRPVRLLGLGVSGLQEQGTMREDLFE
jgi:DNA polymerase-4